MRKGGGKSKGAGFERTICVALSGWLSKGRRKDLFWRSAMSGGRATVFHKKGIKLISQGGDISAIDPFGAALTDHFCIEVKFYKSLDLEAFLLGRGKMAAFWKQVERDANRTGKEPMLIARQNLYPTLVIFRSKSPMVLRKSKFGVHWEKYILWRSPYVAIGLFDEMLKKPYVAPAVIRYKPQGK